MGKIKLPKKYILLSIKKIINIAKNITCKIKE